MSLDTVRPAASDALAPLALDLLNSMSAHVAVLDGRGVIVAVNEPWRRFARENAGSEAACGVGASYLAACRAGTARETGEGAAAMLDGLERLISGDIDRFSLEYPCHAPGEKRWFVAQLSRFAHAGVAHIAVVHENITARKLAEEALRDTESMLRKVLDALPVGVWIMDAQGTIVLGNPAGKSIWAGALYVGPERFGEYKGWWLESGRRIAADEWAAARAIRDGETSIDEEIRIECFDGTSRIILNSAVPLRDAQGAIAGAIIVNQDITQRKAIEADLLRANDAIAAVNRELQHVLAREREKARTDDLTGLRNRRHFHEVGEPMFAAARRYGTPLCVVMLDLDYFKRVNDLFGHPAGDEILRRVARVASAEIRAADVLARYGGEEFVLALPGTSAADSLAVAEKIREKVPACSAAAGVAPAVTISAGIAELRASDRSLDDLVARADRALYAAKNAGRDRSSID